MTTTSVLYNEYAQLAAAAKRRVLAKTSFPNKSRIADAIAELKQALKTRSRKSTDDVIALADIAREITMNPKVARAKCRDDADMLKLRVGDNGWVFNRDDHDRVIEFLTA